MSLFNTTLWNIFNYHSLFLRWSYLSIKSLKPILSVRSIRSFTSIWSFCWTNFILWRCFRNINNSKFFLFWNRRSSFRYACISFRVFYLLRIVRVWSYANLCFSYFDPSIFLCLFIIFYLNANKFICYISVKMKLLIYLI